MIRIVALKDKEPLYEPKKWRFASYLIIIIYNYEKLFLKFILVP